MNGTENLELLKAEDGSYWISNELWPIVNYRTKEEAQKVLYSWRTADKLQERVKELEGAKITANREDPYNTILTNGSGDTFYFNPYQHEELYTFLSDLITKDKADTILDSWRTADKVQEENEALRKKNKFLIENSDAHKECFEKFIPIDNWDEATLFLSTHGSGLAKAMSKKSN